MPATPHGVTGGCLATFIVQGRATWSPGEHPTGRDLALRFVTSAL